VAAGRREVDDRRQHRAGLGRRDEEERSMRFVILLYGDEAAEAALPPEELREIVAQHRALARRLAADAILVAGEGLVPTTAATTVRDGVVSDGPFAEAREQLGGLYVVDCADLDQVLAIAEQVPRSPGLVVEIRPAMS
jgi:hypothetical protein